MKHQTIAVGGGKGGVGKTTVATNLAVAFARTGRNVVIVDATSEGSELHRVLGIRRPHLLLEHFFTQKVEHLEDVVLPTGIPNLAMICGGIPFYCATNSVQSRKMMFIRRLWELDTDVLIVDVGSGVGFHALDIFNGAKHKLVVLSPETTSMQNGYVFIKSAVHRHLQYLLRPYLRKKLNADMMTTGTETISDLLVRIANVASGEAGRITQILRAEKYYLVGNMISNERDYQALNSVQQMISNLIGINPTIIGTMRYDAKLLDRGNDRIHHLLDRTGSHRQISRILDSTESHNGRTICSIEQKLSGEFSKYQPFTFSERIAVKRDFKVQTDKRSYPRFALPGLDAVLNVSGLRFVGKMRNVARGGVMVEFNLPLISDAEGKLTIGPIYQRNSIDVLLRERHRNVASNLVGFSFDSADKRGKQKISDLVVNARAAQIRADKMSLESI
jgi:flagellar biosynthesis protein FlhG